MWVDRIHLEVTDTDPAPRDIALEAFLEGVAFGRGTADLRPITERAAMTRFDRWWEHNPVSNG